MPGFRSVLSATVVVIAVLFAGAAPASAAPPTCTPPAVKTVRPGTITPLVNACGPMFGAAGWTARLRVTDEPDHGTVRIDYNIATTLRYLPAEGYTGPDAFSYEISSPDGTAGPVTQAVMVDAAANTAPSCSAPWPTPKVRAGTTRNLRVWCTDAEGDPLTHVMTDGPDHGAAALAGAGPGWIEVAVTPDAAYAGSDELTVRANDGRANSAPTVIALQVVAAATNTPPSCTPGASTVVFRGQPGGIQVPCQDAEGDPYALEIVTEPSHGVAEGAPLGIDTVIGIPRGITYLPADNRVGPDAISVRARDAMGAASPAYPIAIDVQAPPAPSEPLCYGPDTHQVRTGATRVLAPECSVAAPSAPEIVTQPAHGIVRVVRGGLAYTSDAGYAGPDSFTYRVLSAGGTGPTRAMNVQVAPDANSAPWCGASFWPTGLWINEPVVRAGSSVPVRFSCGDADGDTVAVGVADPPHGAVSALVPTVLKLGEVTARDGRYTPDIGFTGFDVLEVVGTDGQGGTATSTQSVVVRPAAFNSPPQCYQSVIVPVLVAGEDGAVGVLCGDPEGDPVRIEVVDAPDKVTLGAFSPGADGAHSATVSAPADVAGVDQVLVVAVDERGARSTPIGWSFRVVPRPSSVDVDASRGESLGAAESALPTPARPAAVRLTTLNEGRVRIVTRTGSAPAGYSAFGLTFDVQAPEAIPEVPLRLRFRFDASLVPVGLELSAITVFRNGAAVGDCTGPGATPDPCIASRTVLLGGDIEIVVLTSKASVWNFGRPGSAGPSGSVPEPPAPGTVLTSQQSIDGTGGATGSSVQPPTLKLRSVKLRAALTRGLPVSVTSALAGTARARVTLDGRTAKRLRLSKGKLVTAATGSKAVRPGSAATLTARFTKQARKALSRTRSVRLTLRVAVGDGPPATRTITLKR